MLTYHSPADASSRVLIGRNEYDPVVYADYQGGLADCRAALCIARGVPVDQIGPLGHDLSGRF